MTNPPPAMLFAAGFGTRMAPLTNHLPKPLVKVSGIPLVDFALDLLRDAGVTHVVANTHYMANTLEPYLSSHGVLCVREEEILETGGGLKNALPILGANPVLTLNTDGVWSGQNPVKCLLRAWRPECMDALLLVVGQKDAVGHHGVGDFAMDGTGRLSRGPDFVYSGLQLMKTDRLSAIEDAKFSLNRVWDMMARDARLFGLVHDGQWCDVGQPESIPLAEVVSKAANV